MNIDRASCAANEVYFETFIDGIEGRRTNAVILRQPAHPDILHTGAAKAFRQIRTAECGVTILVRIFRLADNLHVLREPEIGMEGRSRRALHTMRRPGTAALLKADVIFRMPITRCEYRYAAGFRLCDPSVQDRDNGIALRHGESTARTEVILHIDDQKRVAGLKRHVTILILTLPLK